MEFLGRQVHCTSSASSDFMKQGVPWQPLPDSSSTQGPEQKEEQQEERRENRGGGP